MGFLQGKRALIVGLSSNRSIAWGVAEAFRREGAELALTYQGEKLRERVERMAGELGAHHCSACDLASDGQIDAVFADLRRSGWESLDVVVHSAAFAPPGQLAGDFLDDVTREGFRIAHDISAYGLVALAKAARPMLRPGGALLTMSYLGAERAVPHYNVMGLAKASLEAAVRYLCASLGPQGVRVNAISAGPIRTAAAKGIGDFNSMLAYAEKNTPLRRNVTIEEVGNSAAFLCSDLASGITGEVIHVDSGYHVMAMPVRQEG